MADLSKDVAANPIDAEQIQTLLVKLTAFTEQYRATEEQRQAREQAVLNQLEGVETSNKQHLNAIRNVLAKFQEELPQAGVTKWQITAEKALQEGKEHIDSINSIYTSITHSVEESCERLDRAATYAIKGIAEAISSFRVSDFKQLTEESCHQVRETSEAAIKRIARTGRWFHWKSLAISIMIALITAMMIGLYIADEWPWEIHNTAVEQRAVGKALLRAWPHLSKPDQAYIRAVTQHIVIKNG